jgi:anti-sigma factor RsiW
MMHIADNHDALLDYLYDEGDPAERLKIAKHLQECATCSVAVLEFKTVRGMLTEWKPPSAQLGFRIVQEPAAAAKPSPSSWPTGQSWASRLRRVPHPSGLVQAAAAVLLFAAGMAASQIRVEYHDGIVTLKSESAARQSGAARTSSIVLPAEAPVATGMGLVPVSASAAVDQAASANRNGHETVDQLLQRVRSMIEQSEARQQRELALRLSQVANEVETQHRADLLRMQQNFGQLEIETGAQINQQQQLMDYLVRTSGGPK